MPTPDDAFLLARYARSCIRATLGGPGGVTPGGGPFDELGASFVSLHAPGGRLQGCIGTLEAHRPLVDDVARNANAAAFRDPRARRLALDDVEHLTVEVAVLAPLERVVATDEQDACAALRPGVDGVLFSWTRHRATFIPKMWRHFPDARVLLGELKQKAGLPADFWAPDVALWRYTTVEAVDPPTVG